MLGLLSLVYTYPWLISSAAGDLTLFFQRLMNTMPATPATAPILYSFRRCPYAMRARLALTVSQHPIIVREILLRDKPAAMLAASTKGSVPVLVLPDGTVIDESLDIMRWALQQHDPAHWLRQQDDALALIAENDGSFKHALDRYKYATRYPEDNDTDWRAQAEVFLAKLEDRLSTTAYLGGVEPNLADYAIFPFIRQFRMPDEVWFDTTAPYPHLRRWLAERLADPLFTRVMTKRPPWQPGDDSTWLAHSAD